MLCTRRSVIGLKCSSRRIYTRGISQRAQWGQRGKGGDTYNKGMSIHWPLLGVATLATLNFNSTAECMPAMAPVAVVIPFEVVASSSILTKLKESIIHYWHALNNKVRKWWRMLVRSAKLAGIFFPVLSALPLVMIFQYEAFVGSRNHIDTDFWWWRALRLAVRASGPCTTKLSQWIATRPDLFPFCLCRNMQELQLEAAPPTGADWTDTVQALEDTVGLDWQKLFHIEEGSVLGSGCIAQVLMGHVIKTHQPIAVKIIHRNVAEIIATDIEIMQYICSWFELLPGVKNFSMSECVHEFDVLMMSQLDLRKEAEALLRFRKNFSCDSQDKMWKHESNNNKVEVTFPKPLPGLAFENVLFETFEEGESISQYLEPDKKKIEKGGFNANEGSSSTTTTAGKTSVATNTKKLLEGSCDDHTRHALATAGVNVMLKMIFEDNFVHADLHSGNIIVRNLRTNEQEAETGVVRREGEGLVVSMIDAGLTAELNDEDRRNFLDLFKGMVLNDGRQVGRLMIERNSQQDRSITLKQSEAFQDRMGEVINSVHVAGLALGRISVTDLLQKVLISCYQNNVKLDSKFVSVMLSIGVMEGMGRRLDPDVDLLRAAAPFVLKASAKFATMQLAKTLHSAQKKHAERHPHRGAYFYSDNNKDWVGPDR